MSLHYIITTMCYYYQIRGYLYNIIRLIKNNNIIAIYNNNNITLSHTKAQCKDTSTCQTTLLAVFSK